MFPINKCLHEWNVVTCIFDIFSDLEGATSHRDYYRDDLPNPKTAEMSQITVDAAASGGLSGGTIDVVSTRGNSQQKQLSYGHQTVTYKASQNKEFLDRITSFNNPKISPHSVLGKPFPLLHTG